MCKIETATNQNCLDVLLRAGALKDHYPKIEHSEAEFVQDTDTIVN